MSVLNGVVAPVVRVEFDATIPLGVKEPGDSNWTALPVDVLRGVSIRRGKTQENQAVQAGEATITLDNRSGDFDPMNSASSYWVESIYGGLSYFSPRLGMRVVATWDEVDYVLYTGYLEQLVMDYGLNPTVTITCTDALAYLAQQQLVSVVDDLSPVGNGDAVWFRVDSLLDPTDVSTRREGCNFPSGLRGIDTSVDNTMYGTRYGSDVLSLLQQAADCGPARLFVDADGLLRLLRWDGGDDPGVLLSDDLSNADAIGYDSIDVDPGSRYLLNTVWVYKVDGNGTDRGRVLGLASDSRTRFGTFANQYTLPTNSAAPVANFLANQYAEPIDRIRRISFSMMNLGTRFPTVLVMDLADYVSVERTTYDGRSLSFECNVEGIEYDITPDGFRAAYLCSTLSAMPTPTSEYWLGLLGFDSTNTWGWSVQVDSGNNIYGAGYSKGLSGPAPLTIQVAKVSSDGTLQAQNSVNLATADGSVGGSAMDLDSNLMVVATKGLYSTTGVLVKFNSSLDVVWQKNLTGSSSCSLSVVGVDDGNNIYVGGELDGQPYVAKFDPYGGLVWEEKIVLSSGTLSLSSGHVSSMAVSQSAAELFITIDGVQYDSWSGAYTNRVYWLKLNLFYGTISGQLDLYGSGGHDSAVACDTSGNSYVTFNDYFGKINGSNTMTYLKQFDGGKTGIVTSVDSDGNCFVSFPEGTSTGLLGGLVKLSAVDGDQEWARGFKVSAFTLAYAKANAAGEVCIAGYASTGGGAASDLLLGKIPTNGARTGTYSIVGPTTKTIEYGTTSYDIYAATPAATTSALSTTSSAVTVADASYTENYFTHFFAKTDI